MSIQRQRLHKIYTFVNKFFDGDRFKVVSWFSTFNPQLGMAPTELLCMNPDKLLKFIEDSLDENECPMDDVELQHRLKAIVVSSKNYQGPFFVCEFGFMKDFFENMAEIVDYCEGNEHLRLPKVAWAARRADVLDVNEVISLARDRVSELVDLDSLKEFLFTWNKRQKEIVWEPDYTRLVCLYDTCQYVEENIGEGLGQLARYCDRPVTHLVNWSPTCSVHTARAEGLMIKVVEKQVLPLITDVD